MFKETKSIRIFGTSFFSSTLPQEGLKIDYDDATYEESLSVAAKMKAGFISAFQARQHKISFFPNSVSLRVSAQIKVRCAGAGVPRVSGWFWGGRMWCGSSGGFGVGSGVGPAGWVALCPG